ncbi:MAG: hypothetical protein WCS35_10210, partial [Sphaerochaeta sp.]
MAFATIGISSLTRYTITNLTSGDSVSYSNYNTRKLMSDHHWWTYWNCDVTVKYVDIRTTD